MDKVQELNVSDEQSKRHFVKLLNKKVACSAKELYTLFSTLVEAEANACTGLSPGLLTPKQILDAAQPLFTR